MQTAKTWHGYNLTTYASVVFRFTTGRRSLRQRKMRSVIVIVTNVVGHQTFQMPLIKHDHMVEQIAAAVFDPAFCNTVLPRISKAVPLGKYAQALHGVDKLLKER